MVPYAALRSLIGEIHYGNHSQVTPLTLLGGRVTDPFDSRVVGSFLARFFNPSIINDRQFYSDLGVTSPNVNIALFTDDATLAFFKNHVTNLSLNESPEVFGLHANADIKLQRGESKKLLDSCQLMTVQGRQQVAA